MTGRPPMDKPRLQIFLASPRGFCAGVERAIEIVELALTRYGPPIYVRHEIVHNRHVVEGLRRKGAVFVERLSEVPPNGRVIFSAHGVPRHVPAEARDRQLAYIDATCPLVSKVHRETVRHHQAGRQCILIGHAGHPEVEGTMGQLPAGAVTLVETADQAHRVEIDTPDKLAYVTQTTLSVDDTSAIIGILRQRFPKIRGPKKDDICYATTNRQQAVKSIANKCDLMIVLGSPNSSNSNRLVETARRAGCPEAILLENAGALDWARLAGITALGVTAGASAPEGLVTQFIQACAERFDVTVREIPGEHETTVFKLPRSLVA